MSQLVLETPHPVHVGGRPAVLWRAQSAVMTAVAFGAMIASGVIVRSGGDGFGSVDLQDAVFAVAGVLAVCLALSAWAEWMRSAAWRATEQRESVGGSGSHWAAGASLFVSAAMAFWTVMTFLGVQNMRELLAADPGMSQGDSGARVLSWAAGFISLAILAATSLRSQLTDYSSSRVAGVVGVVTRVAAIIAAASGMVALPGRALQVAAVSTTAILLLLAAGVSFARRRAL